MRVIAGRFKGRRLAAPDTRDTRPVADRVKEAVFSSLGGMVEGASVADLYAGSGGFGIEALSRGASSVVFVETGRRALAVLRRNISALDTSPGEARVVAEPVERFVRAGGGPDGCFDLVFCDPPWPLAGDLLADVLSDLRSRLSPGGTVVVSRRASDPVPRPAGYEIDDDRRYGDTRIVRYVRTEEQ